MGNDYIYVVTSPAFDRWVQIQKVDRASPQEVRSAVQDVDEKVVVYACAVKSRWRVPAAVVKAHRYRFQAANDVLGTIILLFTVAIATLLLRSLVAFLGSGSAQDAAVVFALAALLEQMLWLDFDVRSSFAPGSLRRQQAASFWRSMTITRAAFFATSIVVLSGTPDGKLLTWSLGFNLALQLATFFKDEDGGGYLKKKAYKARESVRAYFSRTAPSA